MPPFRRAVSLRPPPAPLGGGLSLISACEEVVGNAGCHRAAALGHLTLLLTLAGGADSSSDGVAFSHRPRRVVAVAEGAIYEERMSAGERWHLSYLMMSGPWCVELNRVLRDRPGAVLVLESAAPALRLALSEAVDLALQQPTVWAWRMQSCLSRLFGDLLTLAVERDAPLTAQVGRLIDDEPQRTWQIADLAKRLGVSPAIFARRFSMESGTSPASWIRNRRIDHARKLMKQGLDVAEVAERLGFANPYHFSRVFKSVTGVPPSHIRPAQRGMHLHG